MFDYRNALVVIQKPLNHVGDRVNIDASLPITPQWGLVNNRIVIAISGFVSRHFSASSLLDAGPLKLKGGPDFADRITTTVLYGEARKASNRSERITLQDTKLSEGLNNHRGPRAKVVAIFNF